MAKYIVSKLSAKGRTTEGYWEEFAAAVSTLRGHQLTPVASGTQRQGICAAMR
jgi:hypothetical protein